MPAIPVAAYGAFGELGGVITVEWVPPEPYETEAKLLKIAGYLADFQPPLRAAKRIAMEDMQEHFDTETSPDGAAWMPLDPDYAVTKASRGQPPDILHAWGDMEGIATSGAPYKIGTNDLFFDTGGLPYYWQWHQDGTGPGGSRVLGHAMQVAKFKKAGKVYGGGSHDSQGIGRGQDLPARPFVGISAGAEERIFLAFDVWFSEAISVSVSGAGVFQVRGPKGRFGGKLAI